VAAKLEALIDKINTESRGNINARSRGVLLIPIPFTAGAPEPGL
jgi:hypothetical protein